MGEFILIKGKIKTVKLSVDAHRVLQDGADHDYRDRRPLELVALGLDKYLHSDKIRNVIGLEHIEDTAERYVKSLGELFEGVNKTPEEALNTLFPADGCKTMLHDKEITFFSMCAHHLIPFYGRINFAYIPNEKLVGLSKIPRLVEVYARRPQVQEKLGTDLVSAFDRLVQPHGCAVMIRAFHLCCMARGIKQPTSYFETTALSGVFDTDASTKAEFLSSCNAPKWSI
jgi:GTP cyclohydrolase IA